MNRRLKVAVRLHPGSDGTAADVPEQARHAEQLGLDGILVGDHLKPSLERLAQRLEGADSPGAPYELEKVNAILRELDG